MCKCTPRTRSAPQPEQESILGQFLLGGLDLEVYLDGLWGRQPKKGRQLFRQKSAPQTKSWLRLCVWLQRSSLKLLDFDDSTLQRNTYAASASKQSLKHRSIFHSLRTGRLYPRCGRIEVVPSLPVGYVTGLRHYYFIIGDRRMKLRLSTCVRPLKRPVVTEFYVFDVARKRQCDCWAYTSNNQRCRNGF